LSQVCGHAKLATSGCSGMNDTLNQFAQLDFVEVIFLELSLISYNSVVVRVGLNEKPRLCSFHSFYGTLQVYIVMYEFIHLA
jgi:hypothetical protein